MDNQVEILAYHGWGFDRDFWASWTGILPPHISLKPADRGYFTKATAPSFDPSSAKKILFLHSYGLHWCPKEKFIEADAVVIFNGFGEFLPLKEPGRSRSKKVLNGMITAFSKDPEKVLTQFYSNCFGRRMAPVDISADIDLDLLSADLGQLLVSEFGVPGFGNAKWLVFDAAKDRIVPGQRGRELLHRKESAEYYCDENAGHALPVQETEYCYKILCTELPIFEPK